MDTSEHLILTKAPFGKTCAIEKTLDVIGTKWTFLILHDLLIEGTMRFSDILKSMDGISPKTLALRLRELEQHGLLIRTVYPEVPPRVEYTLTPKGKQLEGVFIEMKRFGLGLID
ncbi:winged helix-turn-helix transcriptional regulator [Paenibacillus guangzhouensis]|uniref:winged helix-turn-helix transcriptional regulator n=1 Tax=Paenibacillus guangzhouensis TaxID=1473112 RepID=UPI001266F6FF|nr:helix-turn-helix domain-containing protein [Paenibacillus guangzhouensis]